MKSTNAFYICFLMLLGAFFVPWQAKSQTTTGIRLGLNASQVRGSDVKEKLKTGVGYNAGLYVKMNLADISLQTELVVSGRNYSFSQNLKDLASLETTVTEKKIRATYLDIPLLIIISLSDHLNLLAGPQASINVSSTQEIIGGDPRGEGFNITSELGATAGLSYNFKSGIDVTLRGLMGLSEIFEKTNFDLAGNKNPDIKTSMLQLTVGLPLSSVNKGDEPDRSSYKTVY